MKVQDIDGETAVLGGSRLLFKSALVLVFAASLAACGGAAKSNSTASDSRSSALATYSNCLKEHGVTLPSDGLGPIGLDSIGLGPVGLDSPRERARRSE